MIGFAAEKMMALEVGAKRGAGYSEKNSLRLAQLDGYRGRELWSRESRSFALPAIFQAFSNLTAWPTGRLRLHRHGVRPGDA